jgi:hypothetical protein
MTTKRKLLQRKPQPLDADSDPRFALFVPADWDKSTLIIT